MRRRSSLFAAVVGPRAKWLVFGVWFVVIFGATAAGIQEKYTDAQQNESTSFLPGDAESTKALLATEDLQGGELAPAVILYRRESGLTAADKQKIVDDVERLTSQRFPASSPTARRRRRAATAETTRRAARRRPRAAAARRRRSPASLTATRRSSARCARRTARPRSCSPTSAATARPRRCSTRSRSGARPCRDPGGGLEVKITGGAGYAADAIEVFENINGTLLGVGDAAGRDPADPDLPLAGLPVHPARRR